MKIQIHMKWKLYLIQEYGVKRYNTWLGGQDMKIPHGNQKKTWPGAVN